MNKIRLPSMMTGRRPYLTESPLVMKQEMPMAKMAQPSPPLRVLYDMCHSSAICAKPGEIMGPQAPTTAVSMLMMSKRRSFFHVGQFNGSLGDSLG